MLNVYFIQYRVSYYFRWPTDLQTLNFNGIIRMLLKIFALGFISFSAQAGIFGTEKNIKQDTLCSVSSPDEAVAQCQEGDVLLYTPPMFGNEQLPVTIAGYMCDFNHPIVWNVGGVSCIFTTARKDSW